MDAAKALEWVIGRLGFVERRAERRERDGLNAGRERVEVAALQWLVGYVGSREPDALQWLVGYVGSREPEAHAIAVAKEARREAWAWREAGGEACEVDRLRGALERADEELRSVVAERDALRAKLEAMAVERARLVVAAYAVVDAAEKDVPSDEEIAAMAAAHPDGCWTATSPFRDCPGDGHFMCRSCSRREEADHG